MKNKIQIYTAPRIEELEIVVENGLAASAPNTISEYSEIDYSGQTDFWQ